MTRAPSAGALALYDGLCWMMLPVLLPVLGLHPRLWGGLGQRFGRWRGAGAGAIWLHGSSSGDLAALVPLADRLRSAGMRTLLSAWTHSGHQMALRRMAGGGAVFRAPLDLGVAVRSVLRRAQPSMLVLECLEIWPRLVSECLAHGLPVAVVNGRLSQRSLDRYLRAPWLFEPCFRGLSLVTALTEEDAERFVVAGVPAGRVVVEQSSKHAVTRGRAESLSPIPRLVLGSLHDGEERILLPWVPRLLEQIPGLEIVLAPRYPHRAGRVMRRLRRHGLSGDLLSSSAAGASQTKGRILVVDRMGELANLYGGARVAFVGGSLVPHGGHNMVEPAVRGVPVLVGPHTEHCQDEAKLLLDAGAALRISDGESFFRASLSILRSPSEGARRGQQAAAVSSRLAGAADRIAARVLALPLGGTR